MTTVQATDITPEILKQIEQMVVESELPPKPPHQVIIGEDRTLDKNKERLLRMTNVVSKFAGTLTLRPIKVHLDCEYNAIEAPAWSDADSITFNERLVGDLSTPEKVTSIKGLSLHEISHIMLTPRTGTVLATNIRKEDLWQAFNALEDQRIEMFMTAKYSNVADWLTATVAQHLLDTPKQIPVSFPLLYGRKYLPVEVRRLVRDNYEQPQHIDEMSKLIDKYITLNLADSKNYDEAFKIIKRYHELVNSLSGQNPDYPQFGTGWARIADPNRHNVRKKGEYKSSSSKPLNKQKQQDMANRVSTDNGTEYGDAQGTGFGSGAGEGGDGKQILQSVVEKVLQSKRREIAQTMKQFSGDAELTGTKLKTLSRHEYSIQQQVDQSVMAQSKSFATELERLRAEHDPGWLRLQSNGKLNVQRYVTGCDVEEAFDQWDMGREDAVDIEAVVLLDISGSMMWALKNAYQSMWAIKRALDKVNASTTVLTFGQYAKLLYSSDERAKPKHMTYAYSEGSTEPLKAIQYARSVLAESKRAIKIIITITDGIWSESRACDDTLMYLRKAGVLTALAYVSNPEWQRPGDVTHIDTHGCAVAVNINRGEDLFTLARQMVKVGVASNLTK